MHEIMLITAEVQHHAASAWILFDQFNKNNFDTIWAVVDMINKLYELQNYVQDSPNGAQFAVSHLGKVANMLCDITNRIIMLNKERNLTLEIKKAEFLKERLVRIQDAIDNVGEIVVAEMEKTMPR